MSIQIGKSGWVDELKAITASLGEDFWADFSPAGAADLRRLRDEIGRALPEDFVEFYRTIGYGSFKGGGEIYSPDEILQCIGSPIYFILGSMTPGEEWCSEEEHGRLWFTRGIDNPAADRFTERALTFGGAKLYDLLQVGSNGCCCYHQLYVGPEPKPFEYCLLTDSLTIEDASDTFSSGLERIIAFYSPEEIC